MLNVRKPLIIVASSPNGFGGLRVLAKWNEDVVDNAIITVDGRACRVQKVFTTKKDGTDIVLLNDAKNGTGKKGDKCIQITCVPTRHEGMVISKPDVSEEVEVDELNELPV